MLSPLFITSQQKPSHIQRLLLSRGKYFQINLLDKLFRAEQRRIILKIGGIDLNRPEIAGIFITEISLGTEKICPQKL